MVWPCLSFYFTSPATVNIWFRMQGLYKASHTNIPTCTSSSFCALLWMTEGGLLSKASGGVKVCTSIPNFPITQLPSAWDMQRQRCWMVLLLCRHPLVHNSSRLMPNLTGSKWRKGRKKINLRKKGEQIKPRRIYYTQQMEERSD